MRFMGIDYGSKKVGVALSDEAGTMAFPHAVILNDALLLESLSRLVEEKEVGAVVFGQSQNYQGESNPIAEKAERFAQALSELKKISIFFEPEMLTTKEAERIQGSTPMTDAAAAALILQSYLDKHTQHGDA